MSRHAEVTLVRLGAWLWDAACSLAQDCRRRGFRAEQVDLYEELMGNVKKARTAGRTIYCPDPYTIDGKRFQ